MGSCFSSSSSSSSSPVTPTAKVISVNGQLHEYPIPITVSRVLLTENSHSSSSSSSLNYFLANSDRLYYDDFIPALDSDEELQTNQIYFVLPSSKLRQPLTASDMAALAVKASLALQNASKRKTGRKGRISPILVVNEPDEIQSENGREISAESETASLKKMNSKSGAAMSRSSSVKRLQRLTSRRAKMAVRSFRLKLSTIHEGSILS